MSNASPPPGFGPPGVPPRSTPIPGSAGPVQPGSAFPPQPGQPGMPPGAIPPGAFGQNPFGPGGPMVPGQGLGYTPPRKSRGGLGWLWGLIAVIVLGSVGVGIWAASKGVSKANKTVKEAEQNAKDISTPGLSDRDRAALGVTGPADQAQNLWDVAVASKFAQNLDNLIAGVPTEFVELDIYDQYAVATARDPVQKTHVDWYSWRGAKIDLTQPRSNDPDLEGKTFTVNDVPWDKLAGLVSQATARLQVENPTSVYVIIDKGTFGEAGLTLRVYVSGARNSGYVQADENATIVTVYGG